MISDQFGLMVRQGRLRECIAAMEDILRSMRATPYHSVLDRTFSHLAEPGALYLASYHEKASAQTHVKALYFEMNDFTINTDLWFFSGFGYEKAGDLRDLNWLSDWDHEGEDEFTLSGMEPVQEAFARLYGNQGQPLAVRLAGELAEHLVTARYMEVIADAHERAKRLRPELRGVRVFAAAHDWDDVQVTE